MAAQWARCYNARDWEGLRNVFADANVRVDHRHLGADELRVADAILKFNRGLVELAPDERPHMIRLREFTPTLALMRLDLRGHDAGGGVIEVPHLILSSVRDWRIDRIEAFELGGEDVACTRFAELARADRPAVPRGT